MGRVPTVGALDTTGLDIDPAVLEHMLTVDVESWKTEIPQLEEHYAKLGKTMPEELRGQLRELEERLGA